MTASFRNAHLPETLRQTIAANHRRHLNNTADGSLEEGWSAGIKSRGPHTRLRVG
jgi:hypothetical protein